MKIGIDARMLSSNFGIGRYVQQLVLHLQKIDKENQYLIFLRQENFDEVEIENLNFTKILADIPWYTLGEQSEFLSILQKNPVDLMHFPHWNVPYFYDGKFVVTIHDLTMYHYARPETSTLGHFKFWVKDKAHRTLIKHLVKKTKHIITTSEFTARDIVETLGVDRDKITVTYQAPFVNNDLKENIANVLEKFKIDKKFVLYVGAAYPHKNLDNLLSSWQIFNEEKSNDYNLVLVGKDNYYYQNLKNKFVDLKNVIFTGLVGDSDLVDLYKKASVFVFPSLYEGFGLPPLEASLYALPVAASSASCLPEVLGEGAMYFDPHNKAQMADVLYTILTDENIRSELKYQARENLKRFSWEKLATETKDIYLNL
ncbi:MAG: glycosyltransferase family 1 protein [Patescibacteria group bacterium]|nr:glycosyltransferase family 1 protein [Patescibacteria group bacterium]